MITDKFNCSSTIHINRNWRRLVAFASFKSKCISYMKSMFRLSKMSAVTIKKRLPLPTCPDRRRSTQANYFHFQHMSKV